MTNFYTKIFLTHHKEIKTAQLVSEGQALLPPEQKSSYSHENRNQTERTQESKKENNQAIGKQYAGNRSEMNASHRGGKEKEEKTGMSK